MVADDDIKALLNEANESEGISVELKDDVSSLLTESLKSDENTIELTAEDVAWADSCFAFGAELSDDKWIALKDALLDALDSYPTNDEAPSAGAESNGEHEVIQAKEATEGDHVMEDYPSEDMQKEKVSDAEVSVSQEDTWRNIFKVNDHAAEHHLAEEIQKEVSNVITEAAVWSRSASSGSSALFSATSSCRLPSCLPVIPPSSAGNLDLLLRLIFRIFFLP